jgi:hypothetical protein
MLCFSVESPPRLIVGALATSVMVARLGASNSQRAMHRLPKRLQSSRSSIACSAGWSLVRWSGRVPACRHQIHTLAVARVGCSLTLRCTRSAPAGFARLRPRVNSNVRRHRPCFRTSRSSAKSLQLQRSMKLLHRSLCSCPVVYPFGKTARCTTRSSWLPASMASRSRCMHESIRRPTSTSLEVESMRRSHSKTARTSMANSRVVSKRWFSGGTRGVGRFSSGHGTKVVLPTVRSARFKNDA